MRAKEFITEYKAKASGSSKPVRGDADAALPGVIVQRQLRNTDPYMQYRYGLAMASARAHQQGHVDFEQESPWAENLTLVMWANEDQDTIEMADKLMGVKGTRITDNKSRESKSTETQSPVAKPKRNRYGI